MFETIATGTYRWMGFSKVGNINISRNVIMGRKLKQYPKLQPPHNLQFKKTIIIAFAVESLGAC